MKHLSLTLYLEINNINFIFFVRSNDDQNNFKTIYKFKTKLEGVTNERISNIDKISDVIKENIYTIEKKASNKTVRAVPVKKLLIFSSSPILLLISPTGLLAKYDNGSLNR